MLQVDFNSANGGANGELVGAPEPLEHGDEIITRRYEFYKYVGPLDAETGEAMGDRVASKRRLYEKGSPIVVNENVVEKVTLPWWEK